MKTLLLYLSLTGIGVLEVSGMIVNGYSDQTIFLTMLATGAILGFIKGTFFYD